VPDFKVAFCITCKGRVQHIKETLPQNLEDNPNALFVLLDYDSPDDLASFVDDHCAPQLQSEQLLYFFHPSGTNFRMAHAKNMAHRLAMQAGAEILVNLDADNFTGPHFDDYIVEQFAKNGEHSFLWSRMIQRCNSPTTDRNAEGGTFCVLPRNHDGPHTASFRELEQRYAYNEHPRVRGISGRIVVPAKAFLKVGGYDEKYNDWGPDDKDFNYRLQRLGYAPHEIDGQYLKAIHHSHKLRFREYPHSRPDEETCSGETPVVIDPHSAVVNFGNFGCGDVYELPHIRFLELEKVPTRIFGIGMQKTGTTSLAAALRILGYETAHWESPQWARWVWMEMQTYGKSLTLERWYAATDFPIAPLYKELDKGYPGSKFILTIRKEDDWLRSVERHWDPKYNKWRKDWEWDCFSHRMHQEVYGRRSFDPTVFLARYRRHNAEVIEYFKHRSDDLLVLHIEEGDIWNQLCWFLGKPLPVVPYPRENATGA